MGEPQKSPLFVYFIEFIVLSREHPRVFPNGEDPGLSLKTQTLYRLWVVIDRGRYRQGLQPGCSPKTSTGTQDTPGTPKKHYICVYLRKRKLQRFLTFFFKQLFKFGFHLFLFALSFHLGISELFLFQLHFTCDFCYILV